MRQKKNPPAVWRGDSRVNAGPQRCFDTARPERSEQQKNSTAAHRCVNSDAILAQEIVRCRRTGPDRHPGSPGPGRPDPRREAVGRPAEDVSPISHVTFPARRTEQIRNPLTSTNDDVTFLALTAAQSAIHARTPLTWENVAKKVKCIADRDHHAEKKLLWKQHRCCAPRHGGLHDVIGMGYQGVFRSCSHREPQRSSSQAGQKRPYTISLKSPIHSGSKRGS